jgi:hypothetical protein
MPRLLSPSLRQFLQLSGIALATVCSTTMIISPKALAQSSSENHPTLVENYGKLPLVFELNQGQTDSRVKFLSRGQGYSIYLTGTSATLELLEPSRLASRSGLPRNAARGKTPPNRSDLIGMELVNAKSATKNRGQ